MYYRDKVVRVFVPRFRAPLQSQTLSTHSLYSCTCSAARCYYAASARALLTTLAQRVPI
jgi:hypothetical protein